MNDSVELLADLSPMAAVVVIAGVLASVITQLVKRPEWTAGRAQLVAVALSALLGVAAYIVSGFAVGVPDSVVDVVTSAVLIIAGVAVMSRAAYAVIGHALPTRSASQELRE